MKVEEMKAEFVKNELTSLLRKADKDIEFAVYSKTESGEEYVLVKFNGGGQKLICVTCDSLLAITKDVVKSIQY